MKKHVGILFPPAQSGGVYQYALSIADSLMSHSDAFQYSPLQEEQKPGLFDGESVGSGHTILIPYRHISLLRKSLHLCSLATNVTIFFLQDFQKILSKNSIDLVVIPTPFSFTIPSRTPYIAGIPDLMHRYYPEFPEYDIIERLTRDVVYGYYAKNSLLNVVDSEQGSKDVEKFLGVGKEKNRIISYIPPSYVYRYKNMNYEEQERILAAYNLPERYIFYPAQFWFQKNHERLIKALHVIRERYHAAIPLVLVGSAERKNYEPIYRRLTELIRNLHMEDQVRHLGYVGEKEMVALYKRAVALVAPPFQGPTTIPPLEAMMLGTPVATVHLYELPKEVGDAGLLFDPFDIEDIADKIYRLWQDEGLRKTLIEHGHRRMQNVTQEAYGKNWEKIIQEAFTLL